MTMPEPDPFALPAFILSIVGLVVATIGAMTGVVSLLWQIIVRTRGAHRVGVQAIPGMMLLMADGTSLGPYIQIEIVNRGAAPVQVRNWSIQLASGNALLVAVQPAFPPSPRLPHILEPGTSVSFYSLASDLEEAATPSDLSKARASVLLATGQRVLGRKGELIGTRRLVKRGEVNPERASTL